MPVHLRTLSPPHSQYVPNQFLLVSFPISSMDCCKFPPYLCVTRWIFENLNRITWHLLEGNPNPTPWPANSLFSCRPPSWVSAARSTLFALLWIHSCLAPCLPRLVHWGRVSCWEPELTLWLVQLGSLLWWCHTHLTLIWVLGSQTLDFMPPTWTVSALTAEPAPCLLPSFLTSSKGMCIYSMHLFSFSRLSGMLNLGLPQTSPNRKAHFSIPM